MGGEAGSNIWRVNVPWKSGRFLVSVSHSHTLSPVEGLTWWPRVATILALRGGADRLPRKYTRYVDTESLVAEPRELELWWRSASLQSHAELSRCGIGSVNG